MGDDGKFLDAESIWFWFCYSSAVRTQTRGFGGAVKRSCELADVKMVITKLYLGGKLNDEHLLVMKKWGDKRRTPNQRIWSQQRDSALWREAMDTLNKECRARGWICQ